jgi:hypothetical protein
LKIIYINREPGPERNTLTRELSGAKNCVLPKGEVADLAETGK